MAHPRFCAAHWPKPLTAPGAAQACPTCLPSPSNQRTGHGDMRPDRPNERAVRSAPVPSQFGGFMSGTAGLLADQNHFSHIPDHTATDLRTCEITPPICHFAAGVSGFPAHAHRFGQIGAPVMTTGVRVVHLNGPSASLPLQINALTFRVADSSRLLDFPSLMSVPCSGRQGLRPLAPPFLTGAAHQLTFPAYPGFCRPFERAVRFASVLSRIGVFTLVHPAISPQPVRNLVPDALICGHCSGRRALRFLGPSALADAAMQRSFPDFSGFIRPFSPSSPAPNSRLQTQRKGAGICIDLSTGVLGNKFQNSSNNPAQQIGLSYLRGHFPGPNDRQDSTFSRKKCGRVAGAIFPPLLRVSGTLRRKFPFFQPPTTTQTHTYDTQQKIHPH